MKRKNEGVQGSSSPEQKANYFTSHVICTGLAFQSSKGLKNALQDALFKLQDFEELYKEQTKKSRREK